MKEVSLSGSPREGVGKKDATAVRNAERVPCVAYGGKEQLHFSVKHTDIEKLILTPNVYIINVDVEGTKVQTIIQDIQYHPITDKVRHVDFLELFPDKKVKLHIPVKFDGRAPGVLNGGTLNRVFRKLRVYALPGDLPDQIVVDISELKIGGAIKIDDVATGTLDILHPASAVICSVKMARGALEEDEEEEVELDEEGNPIIPEGEEGAAEGEAGEGGEAKEDGGEAEGGGE